MRPRILVTGGEGQLGYELSRQFSTQYEVHALDRTGLDLGSADAIRTVCRSIRPELILNAGAYTAVDKAESEEATAARINAEAPAVLADEANTLGATLVHYSTDYVFDGAASKPYVESDATAPQSAYGRTKLAGEIAVREIALRHLVLRVSWLYGNRRQNFFLTMLRLAREREELRVVNDQTGSPTWVRSVAAATAAAISPAGDLTIPGGLYHLAASGETTWHGFAAAILDGTTDSQRRATVVTPISTAQFPTPAKRPAFSVLSSEKFCRAAEWRMPSWQDQLAGCISERQANKL